MKKRSSLRTQLVTILLVFVVTVLALVYFMQTTFLDDFYKNSKIKSLKSVSDSVADSLERDDELEDVIEHIAMSNEVCVRVVSNAEKYNYSGPCTLRSLDNVTINMMASEVMDTPDKAKLFDDFHYQRRFDQSPEDVYIYALLKDIDNERVMVMVSSGITPLNTTISTIRSQYLIIAFIIILMTLLLALILSRYIIRPVKQINDESRNLSRGEYDGDKIRSSSLEFAELNNTLIEANEDILKADKAKRELLGNVSHDLRTPLTMIVGYGEMMKDLPEEKTDENIDVIINEAKRLSTLVDDLIDVSKMDAISLELNKEKVSLNAFLQDVSHQYELYCRNQGIDFRLELSDDIKVEFDVKRMKQVLYNFINNSLNYNNKTEQQIILGVEKHDEKYRVYVYDNGEGIRQEDLANIWDRYYKVDKEHRRHHIGSGIGLSLARQLLDAHGFAYGVQSEYGEYTRFYFDLLPCE